MQITISIKIIMNILLKCASVMEARSVFCAEVLQFPTRCLTVYEGAGDVTARIVWMR